MNTEYNYTYQQAVEDGILAEVFKNRWNELTGGAPLLATAHIFNEFSLAAFQEMWNEFVAWRKTVKPTLPEADQMFTTKMNSQTVWLIEDGATFTFMFPEDY